MNKTIDRDALDLAILTLSQARRLLNREVRAVSLRVDGKVVRVWMRPNGESDQSFFEIFLTRNARPRRRIAVCSCDMEDVVENLMAVTEGKTG